MNLKVIQSCSNWFAPDWRTWSPGMLFLWWKWPCPSAGLSTACLKTWRPTGKSVETWPRRSGLCRAWWAPLIGPATSPRGSAGPWRRCVKTWTLPMASWPSSPRFHLFLVSWNQTTSRRSSRVWTRSWTTVTRSWTRPCRSSTAECWTGSMRPWRAGAPPAGRLSQTFRPGVPHLQLGLPPATAPQWVQ